MNDIRKFIMNDIRKFNSEFERLGNCSTNPNPKFRLKKS